jgi:hypothetical protein
MTSPTGVADAAILSKAEEAGQGLAHSMSLVEIETTLKSPSVRIHHEWIVDNTSFSLTVARFGGMSIAFTADTEHQAALEDTQSFIL